MLVAVAEGDYVTVPIEDPGRGIGSASRKDGGAYLAEMEEKMREAARRFDFKQAAAFRDRLQEIRSRVVLETGAP